MKKKENQEILNIFLIIVVAIMLLLTIISLSKVKIEGDCKIDNLSFNINETNDMENISLSNGEVSCKFKLETPVWVMLSG